MKKAMKFLGILEEKIQDEETVRRFFMRVLVAIHIVMWGSTFAVLWMAIVVIESIEGNDPISALTPKMIAGFVIALGVYLLGMFIEIRSFQKPKTQFLGRWFLQSAGFMISAQSLVLLGYVIGTISGNIPNPGATLEVVIGVAFGLLGITLVTWSQRPDLDFTKAPKT